MKKLVISAITASVASATALASESEWARLDRDVQALSASLSGLESSGVKLSGYIRAAYLNSGDVDVETVPDDPMTPANDPQFGDLGDFSVLNARLKASGTVGDVEYVLQAGFESAGSPSLLKDAYINIPIGSNLQVRTGQFKAIVARDSLVSSSKLFFADRSELGTLFASRREGIALLGNFEAFDWAITVQDGADEAADEFFFAVRGAIDLMGDGVDMIEGAYGAPEDIESTIAVSYWDDGFQEESDGFLVEGTITTRMFSINGWVADIGDSVYRGNESGTLLGNYNDLLDASFIGADSTPFGIMATFMITQATPEQGGWEIGVRFQDMDDTADTNIIDLGINYYAAGHNYKYFLQYKTLDNDNGDSDLIAVGINVGF